MNNEKKLLREKINILVRDLYSIRRTMESLGNFPEVFNKKTKVFGNSCHVVLPKEYLNKKVKVIVS